MPPEKNFWCTYGAGHERAPNIFSPAIPLKSAGNLQFSGKPVGF